VETAGGGRRGHDHLFGWIGGEEAKNKSYSYRIRAVNAVGKSPYSNTASVKTPK